MDDQAFWEQMRRGLLLLAQDPQHKRAVMMMVKAIDARYRCTPPEPALAPVVEECTTA